MNQITFIDLFCGCGGFSNGLEATGLKCLAGVDQDRNALDTFTKNHAEDVVTLCRDLSSYSAQDLSAAIGVAQVDIIVGGPPCQGFSTARQFLGSNSGKRLVPDSRRELYLDFFRFIAYFEPKVFVMENVLGVRSSQNGKYFSAIQSEARKIGYRVVATEIKAWEYGVPQQRRRQLFIGTLSSLPVFSPDEMIKRTHGESSPHFEPIVTLGEAIGDLPELIAGSGDEKQAYDLVGRRRHVRKYGGRFLFNIVHADKADVLTWHCARPHLERDLRDFSKIREGDTSKTTLARGVEMEFPYNREIFKDRYKRQDSNALCSTILAHLRSDGLHFIHPSQNRSFTPREAARVQTFPDTFSFSGQRSHVFAQIGNAVPPLVGQAVGKGLLDYLGKNTFYNNTRKIKLTENQREHTIARLEKFLYECNFTLLEQTSNEDFLKGWYDIHSLLPELHPESVKDNGTEISPIPNRQTSLCTAPYFIRSGWPTSLVKIAIEAARRYSIGLINRDQYLFRTKPCQKQKASVVT